MLTSLMLHVVDGHVRRYERLALFLSLWQFFNEPLLCFFGTLDVLYLYTATHEDSVTLEQRILQEARNKWLFAVISPRFFHKLRQYQCLRQIIAASSLALITTFWRKPCSDGFFTSWFKSSPTHHPLSLEFLSLARTTKLFSQGTRSRTLSWLLRYTCGLNGVFSGTSFQ